MTAFSEILDQIAPAGDCWIADPSDDWRQGRTLFGGLSAALCLAACERAVPGLPPLRSAQTTYIGPSAGTAELRPVILRRGKSVTFMACDLLADGALATRTLFAFGGERPAELRLPGTGMPPVQHPEMCPPLWTGERRPGFTRHFDQRLAGGAPPNGGASQGELIVWARHVDIGASRQPALVAIGDALPPAAMSRVTGSTIISTMTWHLDVVDCAAFDPTAFTLLHSFEDAARDGYSSQNMAMWNEDGRLIALGRQNVAVFA